MAEIQWNLLANMPNAGETFLNSYKQGQETRALTDYARDPSTGNLNALAPFKPEFVAQQKLAQQAEQKKMASENMVRDVTARAVQGDPEARSQLAYYNSELYLKLGDAQKKQVDTAMNTIGQYAFNILQLPEQQQGPALQQALQSLQAQGMDTSKFQLTGNTRQDLMSALAQSGQLDKWESFSQPKYQANGEAGLTGFQFGQPIMQGGQAKNFGQQQGPQVGAVEGGYRFKGGDPANPASWEKVGGGTGNGVGGFQPVGIPGERVTSTLRSPAHNAAVGGVKNSYHLTGKARDSVPPPGMSMQRYYQMLKAQNPNLDVINEGNHIHMEPKG